MKAVFAGQIAFLLLLVSVSAQPLPEPGLVIYGQLKLNGITPVAEGNLVWTVQAGSEQVSITTQWTLVDGQPGYVAVIPFETRQLETNLFSPTTNTFALADTAVAYTRSVSWNGSTIVLSDPGLAQFNFGSEDRGRMDRIDLTVYTDPHLAWRSKYFSAADLADTNKESTLWGDKADPDHDGRENLVEYSMGLNPVLSEIITENIIKASLLRTNSQGFQCIYYRERTNDSSLQIIPEVSSDRTNWFSGPTYLQLLNSQAIDTEFDGKTYQDLVPIAPGQPRYIRLRVVR